MREKRILIHSSAAVSSQLRGKQGETRERIGERGIAGSLSPGQYQKRRTFGFVSFGGEVGEKEQPYFMGESVNK